MSFRITYRRLFEVHILHDYLHSDPTLQNNGGVSSLLDIFPTQHSRKLFSQYNLVFRKSLTGFYVGIKLDADRSTADEAYPFIPLDSRLTFSFGVRLVNPYFYHLTNLGLREGKEEAYYFSNASDNSLNGKTYLSQPIPPFDDEMAYESGDMYQAGNQVFEAVKGNGPGALDPSQWTVIPQAKTYVSRADRLQLLARRFSTDIDVDSTADPTTTVRVKLSDPRDELGLLEVEADSSDNPNRISLGNPTRLTVDATSLNPGRYALEIDREENNQTILVDPTIGGNLYLSDELFLNHPFGVIDIHHRSAGPVAELLVTGEGEAQTLFEETPTFYLHFHNRSTFWRYIFKKEQQVANNELGEFVRDGDGNEKNRFITREPQPLTEAYHPINKFNEADNQLPNPDISLIKPNNEDQQIYSEIYINA